MRSTLLCLLWLVATAFGRSPVARINVTQDAPTELSNQPVGSWNLVSMETIRPNGETVYPFFGKHPEGLVAPSRK